MGWDINYGNLSKKDCVNDLLNSMKRSNWIVHDYASTTQGAYFAVTVPSGESFIYCALIKRSGKYYAVKTMDEGMGPAMNDCPLYLLDLVKGNGSYSEEWRNRVKAYHLNKKRAKSLVNTLSEGQTIELYGKRYVVTSNNGSNLSAIGLLDAVKYKITKKHFTKIQLV